jgi:hypothetical protein
MTTPDGAGDADPMRERGRPGVGRQERAVADASSAPATVPGLVVTEQRLADGRHITYFEVAR